MRSKVQTTSHFFFQCWSFRESSSKRISQPRPTPLKLYLNFLQQSVTLSAQPGLDQPQDCSTACETRTMGWQEQGWLVCASFLGFVASVQSITRGELFPFGPSARDQLLESGTDQTHQLNLDRPVLFYDGTFDSIFVSLSTSCCSISHAGFD